MKNLPLVSVIIPAYNRAEWLPKSIGSVISQTYSNWEIIVWDDGSSDNTEEVVNSFNEKRIRYFRDGNRGVSFARNRAVEKSRGEYIAFLDSDDQWEVNKLSRQVGVMERYLILDCLFTNYININLVTGITAEGFAQNKINLDNLKTELLEKYVLQINEGMPESLSILYFSLFIQLSSVLVRKSALVKVGYFNETLKNCEDTEYLWRMGLLDIKFAFIDEILMNRNKPPESLSSRSVENRLNYLDALDNCRAESLKMGRVDLVKGLKVSYKNAWLGLIRLYNIQGNKRKSIETFIRSCEYGVSWVSFSLLAEAFYGYENTGRIKKMMKIEKRNVDHSESVR
jgi:glycosyltransferase involved in cell wall biosynthesis